MLQIPLFPLNTVLFPEGRLPLQIFEVRYLDMVRRCQRENAPFGVVTLTEGQEVQHLDSAHGGYSPEGFASVGTLAHIVELTQPQPGLMLIACMAGERFRVERCEKLKHGLWVADVELLPVDMTVPVPAELAGIPEALHRLLVRLQTEFPATIQTLPGYTPEAAPWNNAGWVANRWAELLPLDSATKQHLLTLDSPLLRLELVGDVLEQLGIPH